jgi:hypothetical protein
MDNVRHPKFALQYKQKPQPFKLHSTAKDGGHFWSAAYSDEFVPSKLEADG